MYVRILLFQFCKLWGLTNGLNRKYISIIWLEIKTHITGEVSYFAHMTSDDCNHNGHWLTDPSRGKICRVPCKMDIALLAVLFDRPFTIALCSFTQNWFPVGKKKTVFCLIQIGKWNLLLKHFFLSGWQCLVYGHTIDVSIYIYITLNDHTIVW